MQLTLVSREQLRSLGAFLVNEFDSLVARLQKSWGIEHNDDDTHGHVHSDSIATGRLTFSDILETDVNQGQVDNFNPGGLDTAAIVRLAGTGDGGDNPQILITGIKLPQDEQSVVLDGRVLVIENYTDRLYVILSHEDTASSPHNRLTLPFNTPSDELSTSTRLMIPPRGLQVIIYNAKTARWLVHSTDNSNIVASYSSADSENDLTFPGLVSCGTALIEKTAFGKFISGFESSNIPVNARKRITNIGEWAIDILHANVDSIERNRVYCPGMIRYRLHPRETVDLYRRAEGGWRLVASGKADQWIDVNHSAGNFTVSGGGSWTVDSADQITYIYQIDGNMMTVSFVIRNTDVGATANFLKITIPASRVSARQMRTHLAYAVNAGVAAPQAYCEVTAGGTSIDIYSDIAGTAWTATAADNTSVSGQITFMILDEDIEEPHTDIAHGDSAHSDQAHSDVTHSDVAHGDSHGDSSHTDVAHEDVAHGDASSHSDSHDDVAHSDSAHTDIAHEDIHGDSTVHIDHTDGVAHADTNPHGDSHTDTAHEDVAHSDTAHSDSHTDESTHTDSAHEDTAHSDAGHTDTHSDTVPHSDVAHQDVAHGDAAHSDAAHQDIGFHTDTAHVDI